jgi:hypothetical protein
LLVTALITTLVGALIGALGSASSGGFPTVSLVLSALHHLAHRLARYFRSLAACQIDSLVIAFVGALVRGLPVSLPISSLHRLMLGD